MSRTKAPRQHQVSSTRGSWDYDILEDGSIHFTKSSKIAGEAELLEAHGTFWVFGIMRRLKGGVEYFSNGRVTGYPLFKGKIWGVFYPPFSLARSLVEDVDFKAEGLLSSSPLPQGIPDGPVIFPVLAGVPFPSSVIEVECYLKKVAHLHPVPLASPASTLSRKAKRMIDQGFTSTERLSELARKLRTTGPQLSRAFKRDYGLSPHAYRNHLRVTVAKLTLLQGKSSIVDAGQKSGFNDLGRLYKALKKSDSPTPGRFRSKIRT